MGKYVEISNGVFRDRLTKCKETKYSNAGIWVDMVVGVGMRGESEFLFLFYKYCTWFSIVKS